VILRRFCPHFISQNLNGIQASTALLELSPERRLAHGNAAGRGHALVVVGQAGDYVDAGVDVFHDSLMSSGTTALRGPLSLFFRLVLKRINAADSGMMPQFASDLNIIANLKITYELDVAESAGGSNDVISHQRMNSQVISTKMTVMARMT